ncbi:hypothetical protein [Streptomyces aureus]
MSLCPRGNPGADTAEVYAVTAADFGPAAEHGIRAGFDVPSEHLMALVLDDSVPVTAGTLRYPAAFGV